MSQFLSSDTENGASPSSYKQSPSTASLPSRLHKNKHTPDLVLDLPGGGDSNSGSVSLNNTPTTPKVINLGEI